MATEKRLIDANIIPYRKSGFPKGDGFDSGLDWAFREDIDKLPTVDAVEVVRCRDCKHYHQYHVGKTTELCEWGKCKLISMDVDMPDNGYCCFGERRTNATE